jgi:hypothetical protein
MFNILSKCFVKNACDQKIRGSARRNSVGTHSLLGDGSHAF